MSQPQVINSAAGATAQGAKKKRKRRPRGQPSLAFKIQEFCDAHRISRSLYYILKQRGEGPVETRIGHATIITIESANLWRKQRATAARA